MWQHCVHQGQEQRQSFKDLSKWHRKWTVLLSCMASDFSVSVISTACASHSLKKNWLMIGLLRGKLGSSLPRGRVAKPDKELLIGYLVSCRLG